MKNDAISIIGGVYHERSLWPTWDQIYGSGGRAAAALVSHVPKVTLHTYCCDEVKSLFIKASDIYKFDLNITEIQSGISFDYLHCMSLPVVRPPPIFIPTYAPIEVNSTAILRFGMLEGSGKVDAEWCVYDPQSESNPECFWTNGSRSEHLAIIGNHSEILNMSGELSVPVAAKKILSSGAEVVVVKAGPAGAFVYTTSGLTKHIPAYKSNTVWTIGSGDIFSAIFAARWAVHHDGPEIAAECASRAVSQYAETMSLPAMSLEELSRMQLLPISTVPGRVYLAGPFFNLAQRWLIDEARRCLIELGLEVFSPVHDVGFGPADEVGPADLAALDSCDRVFAILDGLDAGTIFEVGYASAHKMPVYILAQSVNEDNLTMMIGAKCKIFYDFVSALHYTAWKA